MSKQKTYPVNYLDAENVVVYWDMDFTGQNPIPVRIENASFREGPYVSELRCSYGACNHIGYADCSTKEQTKRLLRLMSELIYLSSTHESKRAIVREFLKVREVWKACSTDYQLMSIGSNGLIGKSWSAWPPPGYENQKVASKYEAA